MDRTARAMVFDGPQAGFRATRFMLPNLHSGQVLAKVLMCTLCGSDIHSYRGDRRTACPTILGHEILGQVAELPADEPIRDAFGRQIHVGDRITWSISASCGDCYYCASSLPQKCVSLFKYGHEKLSDEHPLSGGLAEFCQLAAGTSIARVPCELPDKVACPLNCATATVAAAFRYASDLTSSDLTSQSILIQGAGMLGLTAAALGHCRGARDIIVTDIDPTRLEMAKRFGATQTFTAPERSGELKRCVDALTCGRGVDAAFEMSGSALATETAIDLLRIGGRLILVGAVYPSNAVKLNAEIVVRKLLTIQGVHNYAPRDLLAAVTFLQQSHERFAFADLVLDDYRLQEAESAFDAAASGKAYRVALRP